MLVKPMQKITRYPLLFKRLLPNLIPDSLEYISLLAVIGRTEKAIQSVNSTVKKMEAVFKVNQLENSIDFGVLTDVFHFIT
jgi:hypothetical protein